MTNDTRPPVAPVEGHYAMLRNGDVIGPIKGPFDGEIGPFYLSYNVSWNVDGVCLGIPGCDIIATISPSQMQWAASPPQITGREVMMLQDAAKAGVKASGIMDRLARLEALVSLADAACDYADQNCRAFPIATAPTNREVLFWDSKTKTWRQFFYLDLVCLRDIYPNYTHWAEPLPPPPSTPPLPAVFVELGAALEKIKGAG